VPGGPPVNLRDARFGRDVAHLHHLGVRALAEFLRELGANRLCFTEIEGLLRKYRRLDRALLDRLGIER
jgi:hypothetical protein